MASGFATSGGGSLLGLGGALTNWHFGAFKTDTLAGFIQEAQLADYFWSQGGPQPKIQPFAITTSQDLPGSTHWDPSPVPVGDGGKGPTNVLGSILQEGIGLPTVVLPSILNATWQQGAQDTSQPPIIFSPAPILLPGQVDPGAEEYETQSQKDDEMAIDWGGAFSAGIDLLQGQSVGGGPLGFTDTQAMAARGGSGGPVPANVTVNTKTGKVTPCRRRRRKPLLTDADFAALAKVASLPNNANVRTALAQAIRR